MRRKLLRGLSLLMTTVLLGTSVNLTAFAEGINQSSDEAIDEIVYQVDESEESIEVFDEEYQENDTSDFADGEVPKLSASVGDTVESVRASDEKSDKLTWSIDTNGILSIKGCGDIEISYD